MKKTLLILSVIFMISCKKESGTGTQKHKTVKDSVSVKKSSPTVQNDSIQSVEDIKKEYAAVSSLLLSKKLDSTNFTYYCNEKEGEVVIYKKDGQIKMIKDFYSEHSHFSSSTQYFIRNNQVFFIFQDETSWNFDGGTPEKPETKDDILEKRMYIVNDKAVQCLEKKYSVRSKGNNPDPNKINSRETKCDISELMKNYQLILKNKDKKGELKCL
ncbi:hypothetical protein MKJ01_17270 [Chryseobacterium sp. SSA4.19]|uniref:hypothetical protein n=1 Tax=Chryseobacterium sp. SSA4.19 TaxID=2919915 RepID=UPI001F4D3B00|nr:hypothetical protein [Chryseobacterium sp. SSA4.19]MCJ8155512.1 hypothetical protein [Chryseobacterium sp. SSA4.19]